MKIVKTLLERTLSLKIHDSELERNANDRIAHVVGTLVTSYIVEHPNLLVEVPQVTKREHENSIIIEWRILIYEVRP